MEQNKQKGREGAEAQKLIEHLILPFPEEAWLSAQETARFQDAVYRYYRHFGRTFPWRETSDPYCILVSEMMLQQTQTSRVLPKYLRFMERFPDIPALADAALSEIFSFWQGLGYNRRAKALHDISRICMSKFQGVIPHSEEDLRSLPMVGPATSAAVQAFAWDRPALYLETNIRRVLLYAFFSGKSSVHDRQLYQVLDAVLDREKPKQWYYAFMDYGVFLKSVIPNPNRRSSHYAKQSSFENSNRQVRGAILLVLNERGPSRLDDLAGYISFPRHRVMRALHELESEGMVIVGEPEAEYGPDGRLISIP